MADLMTKIGHNCQFATPVLDGAASALLKDGYTIFQTPVLSPDLTFDKVAQSPVSLAEIIGTRGFLNQEKMKVITQVWENEFRLRKIDLVVCNFAPTVIQVARKRIPVINLGTYWDTPSSLLKEMPRFLNQEKRIEDTRILDVLVKVFGRSRVPETLTRALHGDSTYIFNEPEFDNFHPRNAKPRAIGITGSQEIIAAAEFPKGQKVFAYLHPYRKFAINHIKELSKVRYKIEAYVPGFSEEDKKKYASKNLTFVERQNYQQMKKKYSVILHQAGQGMSQNMALLGIGQILIPTYPEGGINSTSIKMLGLGTVINPRDHEKVDKVMFEKLIEDMFSKSKKEDIWRVTQTFRERKRPQIDQIILKASEKYI